MMRATDTIIGPARGSAIEALNAVPAKITPSRYTPILDYITEVFRLAPLVGIDPAIVVAQSAHETANWTSSWWKDRLNPAGIGITGDPTQNAASGKWQAGTDAARAHIAHLMVYTVGDNWPSVWPDKLHPPAHYDPRFFTVYDAKLQGTVRTINDLTGKWGVDPNYAAGVVARGNQIFPSLPDQNGESTVGELVYGNAQHPASTKHIIWNQAWDDLGPRHNYGVVYHRMLGSLMGTDNYFASGAAALTHYGTGHPGGEDGKLIMWCDPLSQRAPWASGPVKAPWGDGPAFVDKYGVNAVNNDLIAIEISGGYDDPISDTTIETVAQLSAYWADQARIPWDQYPLDPTTGLTFTYWHQEFTGPAEKICPGPVVMNATQQIIDRTAAILKAAQVQVNANPTPPPPQPPAPTPTLLPLPAGMSWELVKRLFGHAKDPDGKDYAFDKGRAASQVWFNDAVRSIPAGQAWDKGSWPQLAKIIRRGDGAWVYSWSNGDTYTSPPVGTKKAA